MLEIDRAVAVVVRWDGSVVPSGGKVEAREGGLTRSGDDVALGCVCLSYDRMKKA